MKHHTLRPSLEEHPLVLLRAIASAHGMDPSNKRSDELVELLHHHLTRPETIARLLAEMEPATRTALDLLIGSEGQLPSHRLQRNPLGGELRQLGAGAMERARPWEAPISPTERLFYLGLLYSGFGVIGSFRGQLLFIPVDI